MPILASGSLIRLQLLREAGVFVTPHPVEVDEEGLRRQAGKTGLPLPDTALKLARAKAEAASPDYPGRLIIAADQILELEGEVFAKPASLAEARSHLRALRGKTHFLHTATSLYKNGQECWSHISRPRLVMRNFSDNFLENYLQLEGETLLGCVGCYRIEGPGIQLFETATGSSDAIAGLPLLPLLAALRAHDALPS